MCDHQPQGASDDGSLAGFDFYREDNACCYLAALQHQKLQRAWRTGEEFLASDVAFTIYGLPERLAPRDHVCVSVCYRSTCPLTFATSDTHRFLLGFSWILTYGVSEKTSVQKLWRGKANMQMS